MKPNQRLRHERELKGWSQQALAEQIGTTALSVSRWECGVTVPKPYFRRKLCALFSKSAEEIGLLPADAEQRSEFQAMPGFHSSQAASTFPAQPRDPMIPSLFKKEAPLVGRESEFQLLKRRLLTHTGSLAIYGLPGVGKTALAVALTHDRDIGDRFRDGVLWVGLGLQPQRLRLLNRWGILLGMAPVEIAKLSSPDLVAAAIRDVIGMRRMLVIIDDAWEIKDALDVKVGGMHCVHLVTTRFPPIALHFAGNETFPIHELSEGDSVALLQQLVPSVVTDERNEARELARSVGGLPLALTLMGKYLQVQAHDQQPRRVQRALEQLRGVDTRLRLTELQASTERSPHLAGDTPLSLQAAIEVSEQQLDQVAREGLHALSMFPAKPNSFSEEAALAACGLSEAVLDTLTDAGLLESCGPGRYTLHQTIADYARIHGASPDVEEKIVAYYTSFVEDHRYDYDLLMSESNNIMTAFDIAFNRRMASSLQRGVNLIAPFLEERGLYGLAEKYLGRTQQLAQASGDEEGLAMTWFHLGRIAQLRGDLRLAECSYQDGLVPARKLGCPELISQLLAHLGEVIVSSGDCPKAEQYLLEGLELACELGHKQRMSLILRNLGEVADDRGDHRQGSALDLQGLELARQVNDWQAMGALLQNLGVKAEWCGDYAQADTYYQEGMVCAQKIRDQQRISALLMNMGMLAFRQKHYVLAEKQYLEALQLACKTENRLRKSATLQNLGMLERVRKRYPRAEAYLEEGLQIARELRHDWLIHETLLEIGELHLQQQQTEKAGAIFQAVLAQTEQMGFQMLVAFALYGLARVEASRKYYPEARLKGQASLELFEKMDHVIQKDIANWLAGLPEQNA